jgi:hypothetical protein
MEFTKAEGAFARLEAARLMKEQPGCRVRGNALMDLLCEFGWCEVPGDPYFDEPEGSYLLTDQVVLALCMIAAIADAP